MSNIGLWLPDPIIPFKSDPTYCQFVMLQHLQTRYEINYKALVGTPKLRAQSWEALESKKLNWMHRELGTTKYDNENLEVIMMYQSGWMYPEQKAEIDHFFNDYLKTVNCKSIIWIDTDNDLQGYWKQKSSRSRMEYATTYFIRTYMQRLLDDGYSVTIKVSYKEMSDMNTDYIPYCVSDFFRFANVNPDPEFALMFFGGIQLRSQDARCSILETIPNTLGRQTYLVDKSWKEIVEPTHNARVGRTRFFDWTNNYGEYISNALVSLDATREDTTAPVSRTSEYYWGATPVITRGVIFPEFDFKYNFSYIGQMELNSQRLIDWLPNVKDVEFRQLAVDEYRKAVKSIIDVNLHYTKYFRQTNNGARFLHEYGSDTID